MLVFLVKNGHEEANARLNLKRDTKSDSYFKKGKGKQISSEYLGADFYNN